MNRIEVAEETLGIAKAPKALRGLAKKAPRVVTSASPREELRALVAQHHAITKTRVSILNQHSDKKLRNGEVVRCRLPKDVCVEAVEFAQRVHGRRLAELEQQIKAVLRSQPIYQHFFRDLFGIRDGIVAAYLVAMVDISVCRKSSALRRYCGYAVMANGRLERPVAGEKNHYNKTLRTRLWQAMGSMWKNGARFTCCEVHEEQRPSSKAKAEAKAAFRSLTIDCAACRATEAPFGKTTKYLDIWVGSKERTLFGPRVVDGRIVPNGATKSVSAQGFCHSKGRNQATDRLLEDLYLVWRTLEGLPVWRPFTEAKLGYAHGGVEIPTLEAQAPRMLTLDEAKAMVGVLDGVPRAAPIDLPAPDESSDVEVFDEDEIDAVVAS